MKKISLVIPCYNEELVVEECYHRIQKVMQQLSYEYEILFVDDGSTDNTYSILEKVASQNSQVKIISFSRNFGHQNAVTAGLQWVTGDGVIILDADLQDPPELFPEMLSLWEQGYEVIYGKRKTRQGESHFKVLSAKLFYKTLNILSEVEIPKDTGDFRLVDRKVVDIINTLPEHNKFLRGLFSWVGFKQIPYEYERPKRIAGNSKYPFKKMYRLAVDGITGFSTKPLNIVGGLGLFSIVISVILFIYSIVSYMMGGPHLSAGWTSLMIGISFFSGIQLVSLWIIAKYIGKIYEESKHRPPYIIDTMINIQKGEVNQ